VPAAFVHQRHDAAQMRRQHQVCAAIAIEIRGLGIAVVVSQFGEARLVPVSERSAASTAKDRR
jgi:hypothetical protein